MDEGDVNLERRIKRSENPIEATKHLLTQAKSRRSYQALNLTNADGELFVGAPTELNNTAISMVVPVAGEGNHLDRGLLSLVTKGDGLRIWRIPLEQEHVYLCAVGGSDDYPQATIQSIQRILEQRPSTSETTTTSPKIS